VKDLIPIFNQHPNWPSIKKLVRTLNKSNAMAYLAGGCVRDALLNRVPKDFDIATSAKPEEIVKLFPNSNKQGKAFGVVVVPCEKGNIEVATFRKDGPYKDGRRPEYVEFLSDKEDAFRRDFTINALFYDLKTNKIIDYVDGIEDLKNQVIRTVGNPEDRFKEDYLRVLRALRFSIQLNFTLDPNTEKILFKYKTKMLETISKDRIYVECFKTLQCRQFEKAMRVFKKLGLLKKLWERIELLNWDFCKKFWNHPVPDELLEDKSFIWALVFYPLLMQEAEYILRNSDNYPLGTHLKEWKFPIKVIKSIKELFYSSCVILDIKKVSFGKKLRILDSALSEGTVFLTKKYLECKKDEITIINNLEKEFNIRAYKGRLPAPLVDGHHLKDFGIPENKQMGDMLDKLYDIQIEKQITSRNHLLKWVGEI